MSHAIIIILDKTKALRESTENEVWQNLLDELEAGATELNRILVADESKHSEEIEHILEAIQEWLETASVSAADFEYDLNQHLAVMEKYL